VTARNLLTPGLLDALHIGVLLCDSRGRPTRANTAAQRLLGCRADGSLAPRAVLLLAEEAERTQVACQQELVIGQTAMQVHAVPMEGGAMLELWDISAAQQLHRASRDLLAAIGATLLAQVEPLGILVEVLSAATDPTDAARVLGHLRAGADALVETLADPDGPTPAATTRADGMGGEADPPWSARLIRPGGLEQPTVLVVHPAEGLLEALAIGLSQTGLRVLAARDLHQALEIAETLTLDVVVLGCGPSGLSAGDAHSKLRTVTAAPMVLLDTGQQQPAELAASAAVAGAVVLPRPVRFADLVAAITQALAADPAAPPATGAEVLAAGDVLLDVQAHVVRVRGEPIQMPIKEFELLRVLLSHAGRAISRERVIELVWGTDFAVGRRNLHTHIKRLRQRIERDPTNPEHLVTIRGFGYRFSRPRRPGPPS
jgi:two-component system response regulator RegX3